MTKTNPDSIGFPGLATWAHRLRMSAPAARIGVWLRPDYDLLMMRAAERVFAIEAHA